MFYPWSNKAKLHNILWWVSSPPSCRMRGHWRSRRSCPAHPSPPPQSPALEPLYRKHRETTEQKRSTDPGPWSTHRYKGHMLAPSLWVNFWVIFVIVSPLLWNSKPVLRLPSPAPEGVGRTRSSARGKRLPHGFPNFEAEEHGWVLAPLHRWEKHICTQKTNEDMKTNLPAWSCDSPRTLYWSLDLLQ